MSQGMRAASKSYKCKETMLPERNATFLTISFQPGETHFKTSNLENCKIMYFCGFLTVNLWEVIITAIENIQLTQFADCSLGLGIIAFA